MQPSATLAAVIGSSPMPRTEVTKKIWDYIKKNKLQDAINRRLINADEKLRAVFGARVKSRCSK
jgi:chromatin remodeling complex protein RSC6